MGVLVISILCIIFGLSLGIPCADAAFDDDKTGYYKFQTNHGDVKEVWVDLDWLIAIYVVSALLDLFSVVTGEFSLLCN